MNITTAYLSEPGGRAVNDDTAAVFAHDGDTFAFVGDGLGAYAGGAQASQAAAEAFRKAACQGSLLTEDTLFAAADAADRAVRSLQEKTHGQMKTTAVFLAVEDGRARWLHVGDSRLYHFRNGLICSVTMDHSVSQMAVLMGEITPEQIRFHEDRNRVLRALGSEKSRPELSQTVILSGGVDVFLLCTDGFWEYVYEKEMEQTLRQAETPKQWLKQMETILRSRVPDDHDNYTAVAVFC